MAASIGERLRLRVLHWGFLVTRPMSLGVRGIVISADDEVLLVRQATFPAGISRRRSGKSERPRRVQITRELEEEACIALEGPPVLHGLFFNTQTSKRDHVAAYVVQLPGLGERTPDWEIREAHLFPSCTPEGTTGAARARLAEILIPRRFPTAGDRRGPQFNRIAPIPTAISVGRQSVNGYKDGCLDSRVDFWRPRA
jgi:hypothetical protein